MTDQNNNFPKQKEDNSYIYFGQANLMKSPNATTELVLFINSVMKNFKYENADRAGILINRKPEIECL